MLQLILDGQVVSTNLTAGEEDCVPPKYLHVHSGAVPCLNLNVPLHQPAVVVNLVLAVSPGGIVQGPFSVVQAPVNHTLPWPASTVIVTGLLELFFTARFQCSARALDEVMRKIPKSTKTVQNRTF